MNLSQRIAIAFTFFLTLLPPAGGSKVRKKVKAMAMRCERFMKGSLITINARAPQLGFEPIGDMVRYGRQERNHTSERSSPRR